MAGRKRIVERRSNNRYKAVDGAYAAISPNSHKLGQITDISIGGLSFKYIDTRDNDTRTGEIQEDAVFLSSMGYYVGNLPFKTVSDYDITPSFSSMKVRKRHIQFTDLNFKQLFDLDYYLRNNVSEQI